MADADVLLQAGFSVDEVRNHLSSAGFSNDEIRSSLNLADYERPNAVAQAIGQGFFGEFFDEAEAGLKTAEQAVGGAVRDYIVNPVLDIFNKEQVPDRSKTYDQNLTEVRAQEQSYGIEHPYEQLAAKVGGGLLQMATPIGALGQAAKGTSTLGRIVRGGATGAGWGGVYGFGAGEEDIYNRLESAGRGATVGAGFGAAIPAALSVPGVVSRFAGREADDFERALVGHTLGKSGKIDKSPAGKAFKTETGKQIGKREQLFQTLKNSFFKEKVTIKDTPSTVSSKLEDFADEVGEELVNISDDVTKLESKVPLKAGPKLDFSEAKDYASFISKADERKAQIMLDDLADLEAQWNSSPKTFKAIDELRRSAGKRFSTSFKGTGGDEARREFNSEIYSAFKDSIDNYLDTLGKVGGKSDTLSRAKAANAKFTAARTFEQSAFNAANKSLGDKLVGDFIGHRLARPIAYTAGLTGGGPVGAALVAGDAARVLARDVVPVQASKALRGIEKGMGALDIFKALSPKAAAASTGNAVQAVQKVGGSSGGPPPGGGGPGLGFKLSKQARRQALFDSLASKPKQLDYVATPDVISREVIKEIADIRGVSPKSITQADIASLTQKELNILRNGLREKFIKEAELNAFLEQNAKQQKQLDYVATTPEATKAIYPRYNPERNVGGSGPINTPILDVVRESPEVDRLAAAAAAPKAPEPLIKQVEGYRPFTPGQVRPDAKISSLRNLSEAEKEAVQNILGKEATVGETIRAQQEAAREVARLRRFEKIPILPKAEKLPAKLLGAPDGPASIWEPAIKIEKSYKPFTPGQIRPDAKISRLRNLSDEEKEVVESILGKEATVGETIRAQRQAAVEAERLQRFEKIPILEKGTKSDPLANIQRASKPLIKPGNIYEPFERGIVNPKAKIIKPSSKGLTPEEESIFRRAEPKVTLPPTKQKAQLPLEKQPEVKPAETPIQKLKQSIDPQEFEGDLISDKSFAQESYLGVSKRKKWDDKVGSGEFAGNEYDLSGTGDVGAKAISKRAKLLEWIAKDRKNGRIFSDKQMVAIEKVENSAEGLSFKGNKVFKPDSEATREFARGIGRAEFEEEEINKLAVAFKSPTRVNGVDISPHKTPDVPKDWEEFLKDAPLPESGKVSKSALAALLTAGGVGTQYVPRGEKSMQDKPKEIQSPKNAITAEDLFEAQVFQESGGNAKAVSPKKAKGLMQLMDATGRELFGKYKTTLKERGIKNDKYDPFDRDQNAFLGKAYMKELLKQFGDPALALTAYHSGPDRVRRLLIKSEGRTLDDILEIPFSKGGLGPEGRKYAKSILSRYEKMRG